MPRDPANENAPRDRPAACPICGKPATAALKSFCSKRCADVDLNRWFSGTYAIPVPDHENGPRDESDDEETR